MRPAKIEHGTRIPFPWKMESGQDRDFHPRQIIQKVHPMKMDEIDRPSFEGVMDGGGISFDGGLTPVIIENALRSTGRDQHAARPRALAGDDDRAVPSGDQRGIELS